MKASTIFLFLLANASFLLAQSWRFEPYSVAEGLPQSQVFALLQDRRGYLWLGTQGGGLARFDGKSFRRFSQKDGLPGSYVNALLEDPAGNIWVATDKGVSRFDGRRFEHFELLKNGNNNVFAIAFDKAGTLWLAGDEGIFSLRPKPNVGRVQNPADVEVSPPAPNVGRVQNPADVEPVHAAISHVDQVTGQPVGKLTAIFCDRSGNVWAGGELGIFKLENGAWRHAWKRKAEVLAFAESTDGQLIAAVFHLGVLTFNGKSWAILNKNQGLPTNKVQCLWQAPDGKIWVGTQDAGICIWDRQAGNFTYLTEREGLCNANVHAILGDRWNNVWLGTSGGGACRYRPGRFEHFDLSNGLRSQFAYAVCEGENGIWFASDRGLSFYNYQTFRHFGEAEGFADIKCRALLLDRRGRLWVGTEGRGLAVLTSPSGAGGSSPSGVGGVVPRFFSKRDGLAGNWIRDFAEDAAGNIWVATTDGGVSKITVNDLPSRSLRFQNMGEAEGLTDPVSALHFDKTNRLWLATSGGIGFFHDGKMRWLGRENELAGVAVRSLAEDELGYLWFGTAGRGVGWVDLYGSAKQGVAAGKTAAEDTDKLADKLGGNLKLPPNLDENNSLNFKLFDQTDSLTSANVYLLQFDKNASSSGLGSRLWVGSETGVDRLTLDANRQILEVRHFGRAEGFRGIETCLNASALATDGSLWFGTVNGLTRYLPLPDSLHGGAPQPHFTGIRLFYEPLENSPMRRLANYDGGLQAGAVFPHDQNHLGFEFFAPDFSNPEKVTYSWRLVGSENDWSPFSFRNEVSYSNLPPGDYVFRVRAKNEEGVVSEPVETVFRIEPPFWKTWWFLLAMAGALLAAIFAGFRWRLRQVKRKAAQDRAQLELQNRILTLEQKARQLQMNPHFIFNALNSIQSLVTAGDLDMARQYILKFGRLMRAVLDNSRQALIPLEKEVETLRHYLEMEQFCRGGNFDFELKTAGVSSDGLQIPPMLLQPFVENAILHGIAPLTQRRGKIELEFLEKDESLEVAIRDNGIGFEQAQRMRSGRRPEQAEINRQSAGIAVTKERLELMNGKQARVEMLEIAGENGAAAGTEVRLAVPVK